jgi:hypothetical protein
MRAAAVLPLPHFSNWVRPLPLPHSRRAACVPRGNAGHRPGLLRRRAEVSLPPHRRATSSVSHHPWLLARHVHHSTLMLTSADIFHLGLAPWADRPLGCRSAGLLWRLAQANSTRPSRPHRFGYRRASVRAATTRRTVVLGRNHGPVAGFIFLFLFDLIKFREIVQTSKICRNWKKYPKITK